MNLKLKFQLSTPINLDMAEVYEKKNITEATDIYAFGCFKKWFIVD